MGETDGTETVEAMFTLFQGKGRGGGQADSCQTGDTKVQSLDAPKNR